MVAIAHPIFYTPELVSGITGSPWSGTELEQFVDGEGGQVYVSGTPSVEVPFWIQLDFGSALELSYWSWISYGASYTLPEDLKIYGSTTGAFAGEETLLFSGTDLSSPTEQGEERKHEFTTTLNCRYYRMEITEWTETTKYTYGFLFDTVIPNTFDTTVDYIEPLNKIESTGWTYCLRDCEYDSASARFFTALCLFAEDLGWDVEVLQPPSKLLLKSDGKDSNQPFCFIVVELNNSSWAFADVYGYWDATTKTGSFALAEDGSYPSQYSNLYSLASGDKISSFGNRDLFALISFDNISLSHDECIVMVGHWPHNSTLLPAHTTLTDGASFGDTTLTVADSSGFEKDNYYSIWGIDGEGQDWGIQCTGITDATHITIDTLPRDYAAGAFIGNAPNKFFRRSYSYKNFGSGKNSGLTAPSTSDYFQLDSYGESFRAPSGTINRDILTPAIAYNNASTPGVISIPENILFGFNQSNDAHVYLIGTKNPSDIGIVTSAGTKVLNDTSKSWTVNEHAGRFVYISSGTGYSINGNYMKIVSNTETSLTIEYNWITEPVVDDAYQIADEVWQQIDNNDSEVFKCGG